MSTWSEVTGSSPPLDPHEPTDPRSATPHLDDRRALPRSPGTPNLALQRLRDDLDDDAAVDRFVSDFLGVLDHRLDRLHTLLDHSDPEPAVTALLTLETSGLMVGATELARTAVRLRGALLEGRPGAIEPLFERLVAAATRARLQLAVG